MPALPQLIEQDIAAINHALEDLLLKTESTIVMVLDKGGFLITQVGDSDNTDITTLAALAAGSFAATSTIAGLVKEPDFTSIYQQGNLFSLLVENIDENCLLMVVFKASISVGAIKFYAKNTAPVIAAQIIVARTRNPDATIDLSMLNLADTKSLFTKREG
jgi:predicted regulator of Ras-like GTPase activity (Roadblock/LC7/MglB family)